MVKYIRIQNTKKTIKKGGGWPWSGKKSQIILDKSLHKSLNIDSETDGFSMKSNPFQETDNYWVVYNNILGEWQYTQKTIIKFDKQLQKRSKTNVVQPNRIGLKYLMLISLLYVMGNVLRGNKEDKDANKMILQQILEIFNYTNKSNPNYIEEIDTIKRNIVKNAKNNTHILEIYFKLLSIFTNDITKDYIRNEYVNDSLLGQSSQFNLWDLLYNLCKIRSFDEKKMFNMDFSEDFSETDATQENSGKNSVKLYKYLTTQFKSTLDIVNQINVKYVYNG